MLKLVMSKIDPLLQAHIELIYDTITDPDGWSTLIETLVHDLGFRAGHISLERLDRTGIKQRYSSGIDPRDTRLLMEHYHKLDIWTQKLCNHTPGRFYLSEALVPQKELVATEFYNDYCKKIDLEYLAGAYIETDNLSGLRIGLHHGRQQGSVEDKLEHINLLAPHLKKAAGLHQQLAVSASLVSKTSAIIDKLPIAALLVDDEATVQYRNERTESLLDTTSNIKICGGRLLVDAQFQKTFEAMILQTVKTAQGENSSAYQSILVVHDAQGAAHFEVRVEPFSSYDQQFGLQYRKAMALVLIKELQPEFPLNDKILNELFSLTKKEYQLASELVKGKSLEQISKDTSRSLNTIKTHLKSLFVKTGAKNQSQLVTRLLSSIAALRRPD